MTDRWTDDALVQDNPALGSFLRDLSAHAADTVDPATRASTLEAMLEVAAQAPSTSRPAPWARRARRVLGLTGVKVALAAGIATATTTGGLAATGSLPAPIQSFAHDVGRKIGIGLPDAPGQQKKLTDEADTGRDFAPGQLKKSEPGTTGRDHAPGQQRDDGASGRSDKGPAGDETPIPPADDLRTDDAGRSGPVAPDKQPPADTVPEQESPGDAGPETPGEPTQAPEQPEPPEPPPDQDPPTGAANETTPDPATAPGRPDAPPPANDQPDSRQTPPDDADPSGQGR